MNAVTFMGLKLAQPDVVQQILIPVVQGVIGKMTDTQSGFGSASTLPVLTGEAKNAQQQRRERALQALQQVITAVAQAQLTTSTGAAQLQATKAQLDACVASASGSGYQVLPSGQVIPGGLQRAKCSATWSHGGKELWYGVYVPTAAQYSGQIAATTAQASTLDAQITAALVKLATDYLTSLFQKQSGASTTSLPTTTVPTIPPPTTVPMPTTPPPTGGPDSVPLPGGSGIGVAVADDLPSGTALAGAGSLGGAGALGGGPGGLGPSGATAAGSSVNAAVAMQGGVAGVSVAGIGTPGAASAATGAGRGAAGAGMMGVGGHGGAAGESGQHTAASWLMEDGPPWTEEEAPDGVIG